MISNGVSQGQIKIKAEKKKDQRKEGLPNEETDIFCTFKQTFLFTLKHLIMRLSYPLGAFFDIFNLVRDLILWFKKKIKMNKIWKFKIIEYMGSNYISNQANFGIFC